MEMKNEEKYLGDVLSTDGRNIKNVRARVAKGKGIVSRILSMLDGIPFGEFYFEIAAILRESLLVSSMLSNSEAWYNVSKAELELLETIDVNFLRNVLNAPRSTPKEMLFLEMGVVPFRELLIKRRISFLHQILNEDKDSMMHRFLQTQLKNMRPKDWITQVLKDINLNASLEEIKVMKKSELKKILKKLVSDTAFERLQKLKENHSKIMNVKHYKLEMQKYLKAR